MSMRNQKSFYYSRNKAYGKSDRWGYGGNDQSDYSYLSTNYNDRKKLKNRWSQYDEESYGHNKYPEYETPDTSSAQQDAKWQHVTICLVFMT